jgi:hypothetical protein
MFETTAQLKSTSAMSDGRIMTREPSLQRGDRIDVVLANASGDRITAFLDRSGEVSVVVTRDGVNHTVAFDARR